MKHKSLLKRTVAWLVAMAMVISIWPGGLAFAYDSNQGDPTFGPPIHFYITESSPVFEGSARVAWGNIIGFLDDGDPPGAVTFTVTVSEAGTYRMHVNHRTFAGAASHTYQINGGSPIIFNYPETVAEYSLFPEEIQLNAGANTIRIAFHSGITELQSVMLQKRTDIVTPVNQVLQVITGEAQWAGLTLNLVDLGMQQGNIYDFSFRVFTPNMDASILVQTMPGWTWRGYRNFFTPQVMEWVTQSGNINLTAADAVIPTELQIVKRGGSPNYDQAITFHIDDFVITRRGANEVIFSEDFEGDTHAFGGGATRTVVDDPAGVTIPTDDNYVMQVVTGEAQWSGIRVSTAAMGLQLGNVYEITFRAWTPRVAAGGVGIVLQANTDNGWSWNVVTDRSAAAFQPEGWHDMSGILNLTDTPITSAANLPVGAGLPTLVMAKLGDGGIYDGQEARFFVDDFVVRNVNTGEIVFSNDFEVDIVPFLYNGGTPSRVPESVIHYIHQPPVGGQHALDVPSLAEIWEDYFLIGSILNPVDVRQRGQNTLAGQRYDILMHHFNALTFENDMKPDAVWNHPWGYAGDRFARPSRDRLYNRLAELDEMLYVMKNDGFAIIGHCLTWHGQSPDWLNLVSGRRQYANHPTYGPRVFLPHAEARQNMYDFVTTVAGHWYDHPQGIQIHTWDVLNEAIRRNHAFPVNVGNPDVFWGHHAWGAIWVPTGEQWNSPWFENYRTDPAPGVNPWDYIYDAFKFARLADPSSLLMYNDFNMQVLYKSYLVMHMVNYINLRWANDTVYNFQAGEFTCVHDYIAAGGRLLIETVGLQTHDSIPGTTYRPGGILNTTPQSHFDNTRTAMERFISTGATISITELDVGVPGYTWSMDVRLSPSDELRQAYHYARLFEMFREFSDHIDRVTFWGFNDRANWIRNSLPHVFDQEFRTKLAYYAVADPEGFLAYHFPPTQIPERPDSRRATAPRATVDIPDGSDWEVDPIWFNDAIDVMLTDVRVEGSNPDAATAEVRALWDDYYLYVLLQVTDPYLRRGSSSPWENDCVEVYLSETNHNYGGYRDGDGQYRVDFMNYRSGAATEIGFRSAARIVEGRGYDIVMAIPFQVITPAEGTIVGFDAQINDRNAADTARTDVMIWNDPSGESWNSTLLWGRLLLGGPLDTETWPCECYVFGPSERFYIMQSNPQFSGAADNPWDDVVRLEFGHHPVLPGNVTFTVYAPIAGTYQMLVHHLTDVGPASHVYRINNGYPITFDYPECSDWQTSPFPEMLNLEAGYQTISIDFDAGSTLLRYIELQLLIGTCGGCCEYCCVCNQMPVFTFNIFNNGEGGSPSTPNEDLAASGIIRMWAQLNGVNAPVYLAATDTITAIDQDGNCAMYFVQVRRVWDDDMGWLYYFNMIDVNKNGPWQYINFTITVYGQTVELLLVNASPNDCGECDEWEWVQVWAAGAVNYTRNYHKLYLMQREYGNTRPYNIDRLWLRSNPSNSFGLLSATSGDDQITGIGLFTDGLTYKFGHGPGDYRNIYRQPNRDMPDITVTEVTWDARWHYQVADLYLTNVERTDGTVVEKYYIGQIFNKAHYVRNGFAGQPAAGFHFGIRLESNRIHIDIWLPEYIYRAEGLQVIDLTDALHNWSTARNGCPIENVGPNPRRTYTRYCAGIAIDAISTWYRRPVTCIC